MPERVAQTLFTSGLRLCPFLGSLFSVYPPLGGGTQNTLGEFWQSQQQDHGLPWCWSTEEMGFDGMMVFVVGSFQGSATQPGELGSVGNSSRSEDELMRCQIEASVSFPPWLLRCLGELQRTQKLWDDATL